MNGHALGNAEPPADKRSAAETQGLDFVTLAMFIIGRLQNMEAPSTVSVVDPGRELTAAQDDIDLPPPHPPVRDLLGGAGSFSALGARLCSPPPLSSKVGWIVDQGSDFPSSLTTLIESWDTTAVLRADPSRLTTRGRNRYGVDGAMETNSFAYATPKKQLGVADLPPALLAAKAIHVMSSPARCRQLVTDLLAARRRVMGDDYFRPLVVWEPAPDACVPDELLNVTNALPVVDICSPNHTELAGLLGDPDCGYDPATGAVSTAAIERGCEQLLASMPLQSFTLVVRAGGMGCFVARNGGRKRGATAAAGAKKPRRKKDYVRGGLQPDTDIGALFAGLLQDDEGAVVREEIEVDPGLERWFPAYHRPGGRDGGDGAGPVVDPTGGGNAFLGGLAVAMARGKPVEEAVHWGAVAASFAIEQVGVPALGKDAAGNETWNGVRVEHRLREMQGR